MATKRNRETPRQRLRREQETTDLLEDLGGLTHWTRRDLELYLESRGIEVTNETTEELRATVESDLDNYLPWEDYR
jgi:hypothetical protein